MVAYSFKEPRLNLSIGGEFIVRTVAYSLYAVLGVGTFILLLSDVAQLRALGFLLAIFLVDRLMHVGEGERSLQEVRGDKVNLALFLTPPAYRQLSYAMRKSLSLHENFHLLLFEGLLRTPDVREAFRRLDVRVEDLNKKISEELARSGAAENVSREELLKEIETLVGIARQEGESSNEKFLYPRTLAVAVAGLNEPSISRILQFFDVSLSDIRGAIIIGRWRGTFRGIRRMPGRSGWFCAPSGFHTSQGDEPRVDLAPNADT